MYHVLMAVQCIGIIILILEIFFIFSQNPSRIQRDMIFLLITLLVIFVAYTLEMQCDNISGALVAIKFGYLGKPFIVFTMLLLILDYCRIRLPGWLCALMVLIQASVSFVVLTAERHMLYYSSIDFTEEGIFPHAVLGHGPFYHVFTVILILYCAAMFGVCFWQLRVLRSRREKRQLWLFIVIVLVALASYGVFQTNVFQGYDCTLVGYLFSTFGFSISFFRLSMFDTITLAKEQAVDYIHCGLLVYDNRDKLIYHNDLADHLGIRDKAPSLAKDHEPFLFEDRIYSVEDRKIEKDGFAYGHMLFIQDMTEHYHYERRLKEEKQRADEASEAKTNFLSSMSHDIRTPMNAILGMTKIAGVHLDNRDKVAECLKKIDISGQHLLELINEVLDINKIESGKLELNIGLFDMREFLEEILTIAKPLAKSRGHEFITEVGSIEQRTVYGDRSRLSQILMNLISNAVKYTNEGGKVWFSAFEEPESAPDGKETPKESSVSYVFEVRDNGIGMSEEYLPYLFNPFIRAKDVETAKIQGTGLGMAITKQFVMLMGGEIEVASKLGEGSDFTVRITLKIGDKEEAAPLPEHTTFEDIVSSAFSGKRVLLVEDNELNAEIAGELLGMTGIEVEYALNGREAVEKIENCGDGYYDLVFMDVQMPVMNGYDATRAIRSMDRPYAKEVPIIAMTANAFAEDVRIAKEAGMNEHLAKPIDVGQLMNLLQMWL